MRRFSILVLGASLFLFATVAWSGDVKKGQVAYEAMDYATAKAEWQERRGEDFDYQPLLGNRPPPLDYRK